MPTTSESREEQSNELSLEPSAPRKWWALLGIGMGVFLFGLDVNIVNLALPTLVRSLHTSFATIQWVILSYVMTIAVLVLSAARLGDMWNKKRLYLGGLIIFTISSLLCGIAPTVGFLIGFRALQGLGAVLISALGAAIVTEIVPDSERGRALGIIGANMLIGIALGPTVGGLLFALGGWRLLFLVNMPIGLLASAIVARAVPSSVSSKASQSFDAIGALMMMATLLCFGLGMTLGQVWGFDSITVLTLLTLAAIGLACFLVVEPRILEPMLDLRIFRNLQFSLSLLLGVMVFIVIAGVNFILPFFLELVKQYPAQEVGLLLAVSPIVAGLIAPLAGTLSDRFGSRILSLIGVVLMASGSFAISTCDDKLTVLGYVMRIALYGLGLGMFQSPNNSAIMGGVPQERLGIASGLMSLSRTLGYIVGVPLVGILFSTLTMTSTELASNIDVTATSVEALVFGVQTTFRVFASILIASVILATFLWGLEQTKAQTFMDTVR